MRQGGDHRAGRRVELVNGVGRAVGRLPDDAEGRVVGEARDVRIRRVALIDDRTRVRIGETLHVVKDALVPAADEEGIVVRLVGQPALRDLAPREAARDRADDVAGGWIPAVDSVVTADVDLAHPIVRGVIGHVGIPGVRPVRRPLPPGLRAGGRVLRVMAGG